MAMVLDLGRLMRLPSIWGFDMRRIWVLVFVSGLLVGCGGESAPVFVERSTFLPDADDRPGSVMFGPDGVSLVAESQPSDEVLVWDVEGWEVTARLAGHSGWVGDVAFSSTGLVGSASERDLSARVWDPVSGEALWVWEFPEPEDSNLRVVFSPDGSLFAVSGSSSIRVWSVDSGELVYELSGDVFMLDMAFSPDGELLYAAADDDRVLVWDLSVGEVVHELELAADTDPVLGLSADGSVLATSPSRSEFVLWDTTTWEEVGRLLAPEVEEGEDPYLLGGAEFSPDGSMVVSAGRRGILVWDVESGEVVFEETDSLEGAFEAVFSPDSERIAVSEFRAGFTLWERNPEG